MKASNVWDVTDPAQFARARLAALLADKAVKDQTLLRAAKQLLKEHPAALSSEGDSQHTVFIIPHNGRGPLPRNAVIAVDVLPENICDVLG